MHVLQRKKTILVLLLWLSVLSIAWSAIATKGTFNDEHDNWVAGQLITQGKIPYLDFFSHHAPLTYYVSALWQSIGSSSPEWMRFGVMSFWLLNFIITFSYVKSSMKKFVGLSFLLSALVAPLVSAHMFLAESLVAATCMTLFWLIYSSTQRSGESRLLLIILATAGLVIAFAAPVYLVTFGCLLFYFYSTQSLHRQLFIAHLQILPLVIMGYLALPVLLVALGAWPDFIADYIVFNASVYYPQRLAHGDQAAVASLLLAPLKNVWSHLSVAGSATFVLLQTVGTTAIQLVHGLTLPQAHAWLEIALKSFGATMGSLDLLLWFALLLNLVFLAFMKKVKLALLFGLALLYLGVRTDELFHQAALYFSAASFTGIVLHATAQSRLPIWLKWLPLSLLMVIVLGAMPSYKQVVKQSSSYYYLTTTAAARFIRLQSLDQATIQNVSGDVGLFHALPHVSSVTRLYYYYPWINASPSLRFEVLSALEAATPTLVYAPDKIDYAPEIQLALEKNYTLLQHGVYIARSQSP